MKIDNDKGQKLLKEWKDRLGLQDWKIKLKINCGQDDIDENSVGEVEWNETNQSAMICIGREEDYGKRVRPYDFEKTLVHELLHIKTCFLTDTPDETLARVGHQLIDSLARALVDAKRSK